MTAQMAGNNCNSPSLLFCPVLPRVHSNGGSSLNRDVPTVQWLAVVGTSHHLHVAITTTQHHYRFTCDVQKLSPPHHMSGHDPVSYSQQYSKAEQTTVTRS